MERKILLAHKGEFYTYPSPNFIWQHDMSPPSEEFMDLKTNEIKKISVVPQPYQKTLPSYFIKSLMELDQLNGLLNME